MKNILIIVFLATLSFAQSYKDFAKEYGYETDYKAALIKAKKEQKPILMVQVTNYCPWCRKLEKKVLAKEKINTDIHKRYIPLIVNREEAKLPKRFATPIVPVTYIIDYKDDTKFTKIMGYKNKKDFTHMIK
ncbi:thioredoxin family protein [Sulfurimonas sp.]